VLDGGLNLDVVDEVLGMVDATLSDDGIHLSLVSDLVDGLLSAERSASVDGDAGVDVAVNTDHGSASTSSGVDLGLDSLLGNNSRLLHGLL
jgi:hypothetical protein